MSETITRLDRLATACTAYLRLAPLTAGAFVVPSVQTYRCDPGYRDVAHVSLYAGSPVDAARVRDALRDQLTDRTATRTTKSDGVHTKWTGTTIEGAEVTISLNEQGAGSTVEDLGEW